MLIEKLWSCFYSQHLISREGRVRFVLKQIKRVNSFDSDKLSVRYKSPNLKEFTVFRKKISPFHSYESQLRVLLE